MEDHLDLFRAQDLMKVWRGGREMRIRPDELQIGDIYQWGGMRYELAISLSRAQAREITHLESFFWDARWWRMTGTRTAYQLSGTNQPYAVPIPGTEIRDFNGILQVHRLLHLPQGALPIS